AGELVEDERGRLRRAGPAALQVEACGELAFDAVEAGEGLGGGLLVPVDLTPEVPLGDARAERGGELVAPFRVAELDGGGPGVALEERGEGVGGVHGLGGQEHRPPGGDGVERDGGEGVALAAAGGSGDDGDRLGAGGGDGGGLFAAEREGAARRLGGARLGRALARLVDGGERGVL